jgi:hypothetical protein
MSSDKKADKKASASRKKRTEEIVISRAREGPPSPSLAPAPSEAKLINSTGNATELKIEIERKDTPPSSVSTNNKNQALSPRPPPLTGGGPKSEVSSATLPIKQMNDAFHVGADATEDKIVPIMLAISLPAEMGGTTHQLVLHQNISIDQVKIALWKQVPALWDGPSRHDYHLVLAKTKQVIDVEFKKILSFDAINNLYQAKKKLKFKLESKNTVVIQSKTQEDRTRSQTAARPPAWQVEADKLAKQLSEAEKKLYRMEKKLTEWKTAVDNQLRGVRGAGSVIISHEKRLVLQVVSQKIQSVLDDKEEATDSESDEEIEVPDGHVFLPRSLNQSIFERFGGKATAAGPGQKKEEKGKKLTPEQHLERIRSEIVSTEEVYVSGLDILVKVYYEPLLAADTIMSRTDVETIFANLNSIYQIHSQLLSDLQKCPKGDFKSLSAAFVHFVPFLKMYTEYVNNFDKAAKRLDKLENNSRVKAFFEEARKRPECQNLDLRSYLITPVQRLPRYELLLRDLHRHIPDSSAEEKQKINDLLNTVAKVNEHVNESKRAAERRQRLYYLKDAASPKGVNIFSRPDRILVKEDTLPIHVLKKEETEDEESRANLVLGTLKFRKRYFFLFDDMLVEVRELKSGKYKFMRNYDMLNLSVFSELPIDASESSNPPSLQGSTSAVETKKPSNTEGGHPDASEGPSSPSTSNGGDSGSPVQSKSLTFVLVENPIGGISREFVIKAKSVEEKQSWMTEIQKACQTAVKRSRRPMFDMSETHSDSDSDDNSSPRASEPKAGTDKKTGGAGKGDGKSGSEGSTSTSSSSNDSAKPKKGDSTPTPAQKKFGIFSRKEKTPKKETSTKTRKKKE